MIRPTLQSFIEKVQGQTVFIVGGGSSLEAFDFNKLDQKITIAINQLAFKLPKATALYWVDDPWAAANYDTLTEHPCKLRFYGMFNAGGIMLERDKAGSCESTVLNRTSSKGFDPDINNVCGNNSGCNVINLCVNAGVKRIILLGFDMKMVGNKSHCHDAYTLAYTPGVYESFLLSLESMKSALDASGVEIINCSMISDITFFKKVPIEDILNEG